MAKPVVAMKIPKGILQGQICSFPSECFLPLFERHGTWKMGRVEWRLTMGWTRIKGQIAQVGIVVGCRAPSKTVMVGTSKLVVPLWIPVLPLLP